MESEPLAPGDAAWLLVLVQNSVPNDQRPGSRANWEGKGRQYAYEMLAAAAGAQLLLCGVGVQPVADEISRISDAVSAATDNPGRTVFVEGQR